MFLRFAMTCQHCICPSAVLKPAEVQLSDKEQYCVQSLQDIYQLVCSHRSLVKQSADLSTA